MLTALQGFHNRLTCRITSKVPQRLPSGEWVYPPIAEALDEAGLFPISHYVEERRNRLAEKVATRPIREVIANMERMSGSPNRQYWWDQFE